MVQAPRYHLEAYARLSAHERGLLGAAVTRNVRDVASRRDLIREGEKPRGVKVVLEGWACRYKQLPNGRRQIVAFFIPGDLCDANVHLLRRMDHSIGAITRVRYGLIEPAEFEEMMAQSPRLTRALAWHDLVVAAMQREWTANIGQRSAYERIAHLFCEMVARLQAVGRFDGHSCEWPLTQTDLADATGLTSVHVNRTLQELRRSGLIELRERRLTILDRTALESVAMFDSNYLHLDGEGSELDAND